MTYNHSKANKPIGIFDSGYGGLTVMRSIVNLLPAYDYLYLGDNARAPYGSRSFETVYRYTWQCVQWFFEQGCHLVILACNTASAKALRTIQQNNLPFVAPEKRVLGVIRPTTEILGSLTKTNEVGILATAGTVSSGSYPIELQKFSPDVRVYQEACPMWVPLVENGETSGPGADFFVRKHIDHLLSQANNIDTILLACTHYPLLMETIRKYSASHLQILSQGDIVASSLMDYLNRHPEIEQRCSKEGTRRFYTTDSPEDFDQKATAFYGEPLQSEQVNF